MRVRLPVRNRRAMPNSFRTLHNKKPHRSRSVACGEVYPEAKHSVFCPPVMLFISTGWAQVR